MSEDKREPFTIESSEIHLMARLRELEGCSYLLNYILHILAPENHSRDKELLEAVNVLNCELWKQKDRTWCNIAMLSPVSNKLHKLVEKRLKAKLSKETHGSFTEFITSSWNYCDTDEKELREHITKRLADALNIRITPNDKVLVEVPKRNLDPEL